MKETDLYRPVRTLLVLMGFKVKGEIGDIDVYAQKDDDIIAVELKTSVSLKLIYQAIERQRITEYVYIAIPKEALHAHRANKKDLIRLLSRLGLGLITVSDGLATVTHDPVDITLKKTQGQTKKKRLRLKHEFEQRQNSKVLGGSLGIIMTAYREKAIMIARYLHTAGPKSVKEIRRDTAIMTVQNIVYDNHYGWFERIGRGFYGLTEKGRTEYEAFLQKLI